MVRILLLTSAVIGRFAGYRHIVRMALGHTGICDAGKLRIVQGIYIGSSSITHTGTQTTDHLVNNFKK